jgi:hypothetical protein
MTPAEKYSEELSLAIDLLTQFNLLALVIIIFIASLISLRLGLSVAIIEIVLGAVFGNLGFLQVTDWMTLVEIICIRASGSVHVFHRSR